MKKLGIFLIFLITSLSTQAQQTQTICNSPIPAGWIIIGLGLCPGPNSGQSFIIENIANLPPGSLVNTCDVGPPPGWITIGYVPNCSFYNGTWYSGNRIEKIAGLPYGSIVSNSLDLPPAGWTVISTNPNGYPFNGSFVPTYTIQNTTKSSNGSLANLVVGGGTFYPPGLSPAFSANTFLYSAGTTYAASIMVTPTTADPTASVTINGKRVTSGSASSAIPLNLGNNAVKVVVTAQDGVSTQIYTVNINRAPPPCNVQDSLALVDLYNSTNGPGWANSSGWLNGPVSGWNGVGLVDLDSSARVSDIYLYKNNLNGTLPSSLGNLAMLAVLVLQDNQLSGTIPVSLGNLSNLNALNLEQNQLSGSIPASLGNLSNLTGLYLFQNQLSGGIPASLGNLSNLNVLILAKNKLSGNIPSLKNLTKLTGLQLWQNDLTFSGMEAIVQLFNSNVLYAPQDTTLRIAQKDSLLTVSAGGTLQNNTYQWYLNSQLVNTIAGDSTFIAKDPGKYSVAVNNSIATRLTLYSDTVIITLPITNFKIAITSAACNGSSNGSVNILASVTLNYTATITGNGLNTPYPFTDSLTINNLAAGTYSVCITIAGQTDFRQCYNIIITQPQNLSVYTTVNNTSNTVNLDLSGGELYNIQLNNELYTTTSSSISLLLKVGNNELVISTNKLCQGMVRKLINASGIISPYPVPFQNTLNLNLGNSNINNVKVEIHNVQDGRMVYSNQYINRSGVLQLDLNNLNDGVYALYLILDNSEKIFKIVKQ